MIYGDEYKVDVPEGCDLESLSQRQLERWFEDAERLTHFHSSPDFSPIHDRTKTQYAGLLSYRVNKDRLIEINDIILRSPVVIRNRVGDVISFQFV
ncbi:MAG: hypothetical protein ACO3WK_03245 [Steroidobacteraceae bacterium]